MHADEHNRQIKNVFTERAKFYVTSGAHTDAEVLARVADWAGGQPGWRALDIATGAGHAAFAIAPHVGEVVAVDLTPAMLREAEALAAERNIRNVKFQTADAHALPFPDGAFDLVLSRRAPHHFRDIRLALREIHRVLKPGGRLIIDDRASPEDDDGDRILHELDILHDPSHVRQYRPSEWRAMLAEAGFTLENEHAYLRVRPASHMKSDVDAAGCARIDAMLDGMTPAQCRTLHAERKNGEWQHAHFFVTIAARKPG